MAVRKLVSFDWALKRLLRSKANFGILEGFLSELLKDDIKILEILEGESNKEHERDKYNRVDLKVKNQKEQILIIEVQYQKELDFLQRILYGASKVLIEHLHQSQRYSEIVKVISISILYFDLGHGTDYIYHGATRFIGMNNMDELQLSADQKEFYGMTLPYEIYPEYYLIKINNFNDIAKNTLDEWIYFLKNEEIKDSFSAKGLSEAKTELDILKLSDEELRVYTDYIEDMRYQASMFDSSFGDGLRKGIQKGEKIGIEKGRKEGIEEGEKIGIEKGKKEGIEEGLREGEATGEKKAKFEIARRLLLSGGMGLEEIANISGLTIEEVKSL